MAAKWAFSCGSMRSPKSSRFSGRATVLVEFRMVWKKIPIPASAAAWSTAVGFERALRVCMLDMVRSVGAGQSSCEASIL